MADDHVFAYVAAYESRGIAECDLDAVRELCRARVTGDSDVAMIVTVGAVPHVVRGTKSVDRLAGPTSLVMVPRHGLGGGFDDAFGGADERCRTCLPEDEPTPPICSREQT